MVVSFPGENLTSIALTYNEALFGITFKGGSGQKFVVEALDVFNLKEFKENIKKRIFGMYANLSDQEKEYISKLIDKENTIPNIMNNYGEFQNIYDVITEEYGQEKASGKYTDEQLDARAHAKLAKFFEDMMPDLAKAPKKEVKKETKKEVKKESKKETKKEEVKEKLSAKDKLKASIEDNKITKKAAQTLLDTVPNLSKDLTQKLQNLIKKSETIIVRAEKALEKLEKADKPTK